ncbi:hypothetical protein X798_06598, partial [Onchocerca flexuosa]
AINFVDTTKHGFRIVLLNSFLDAHLSPTQIPTLFISAIPLKSGEPLISKVFYPDSIREDKQVYLSDLHERSWYYICIEWENFNRHNETTGTDCRLLRTLDKFGKSADTTVEDVELIDITATTMQFKIHSNTNFPIRFPFPFENNSILSIHFDDFPSQFVRFLFPERDLQFISMVLFFYFFQLKVFSPDTIEFLQSISRSFILSTIINCYQLEKIDEY